MTLSSLTKRSKTSYICSSRVSRQLAPSMLGQPCCPVRVRAGGAVSYCVVLCSVVCELLSPVYMIAALSCSVGAAVLLVYAMLCLPADFRDCLPMRQLHFRDRLPMKQLHFRDRLPMTELAVGEAAHWAGCSKHILVLIGRSVW